MLMLWAFFSTGNLKTQAAQRIELDDKIGDIEYFLEAMNPTCLKYENADFEVRLENIELFLSMKYGKMWTDFSEGVSKDAKGG